MRGVIGCNQAFTHRHKREGSTMEMAKVTSKGQITIPISIRRRLGINEGDKLLFIDRPDGVMMVNPDMLSGGQVEESAETAAPTKPAVKSAPPVAAAEVAEVPTVAEAVEVEAAPAPVPEVRRPVPPPVEEPIKPAPRVGGFDLNTLLDEIRSIGSNI